MKFSTILAAALGFSVISDSVYGEKALAANFGFLMNDGNESEPKDFSDRVQKFGDGLRITGVERALFNIVDIGSHMTIFPYTEGPVNENSRFVVIGGVADFDIEMVPVFLRDRVDTIFFTHPYHTNHCKSISKAFPGAKIYATRRHRDMDLGIKLEPEAIETKAFERLAAEQFPGLEFTIPKGLRFVDEQNDALRAAGVLVYHKNSAALHNDDTVLGTQGIPFIMERETLFPNPVTLSQTKSSFAKYEYFKWYLNAFVGTPASHEVALRRMADQKEKGHPNPPFGDEDREHIGLPGCEDVSRLLTYYSRFPLKWFSSAHHIMFSPQKMENDSKCLPLMLAHGINGFKQLVFEEDDDILEILDKIELSSEFFTESDDETGVDDAATDSTDEVVLPDTDEDSVSDTDVDIVPDADDNLVPDADEDVVPDADEDVVPDADEAVAPNADDRPNSDSEQVVSN